MISKTSPKLLNEKDKLDAFSKQIDTDDDHYFNSTMLVMVLAKDGDELSRIEEKLMNAASLKSVELKPCFGKQREALNSVLPYGIQEFKRVTNLSSSCLAMLIPFKTQELNDSNGIYYGINQLSHNVIFADKKLLKNHNGLILGQSGSGKSVFAKMEIVGTYVNYDEDQIIIIDPQNEYGPLASEVDGTVISFDSTKEFYINPMDVDFLGVEYGQVDEIVADKADFILTLLSACMRRQVTAEEESTIDSVVSKVYHENFSMRQRLNGLGAEKSEFQVPAYMRSGEGEKIKQTELSNEEQIRAYSPTLQDVYQELKDCGTDIGAHLAASLEIFVNGSLSLFNHRTNVDLSNRFIVFDLSGLKDNLRLISMLVMMETVRGKIKLNGSKGRWTHLYIDEFHELLAINQVASFVLKLWKEIRKMSGILNGITQNMTDLRNDENGGKLQAILSNTEYFALLSQSSFLLAYLIHKRFREKNVWNSLVKKYKDNTYQKIISEAKFVNKFGAIENKSILYKLDRLVLTSGVKRVFPWMNGEGLLIGMILMAIAGFTEGIMFSSNILVAIFLCVAQAVGFFVIFMFLSGRTYN